ncbi:MAG TPA: hypothetical protein VM533_20055 [Fimbriiglobus sp.]|jgi:hypothetical protein|nr:hypothetical protein [Fimbriiglobus sp.]
MASDKKRRKAAKAAKQKPQVGPFRHPDGDRRHRGLAIRVEDAIKTKERMRTLYGAVDLPEEGKETSG